MITKDYLLKNGFEQDMRAPSSVEDFFKRTKPKGGYISIRFKGGNAVGLYAYTDNNDVNIRKVVLNDTLVTEEDLEMANKICRF